MAIALGKVNVNTMPFVAGDRIELLIDFTCDASYPTGGYTITPSALGFNEIHFVNAAVQAGPTATVTGFTYDYVNNKLKAVAGTAEVANATNLSTVVGRLVVKGRGFPIAGPFGS